LLVHFIVRGIRELLRGPLILVLEQFHL
jgi:hypothetical protein